MKTITEQLLALKRPSVLMTVALPAAGKTTAVGSILEALKLRDRDIPAASICTDGIRQELVGPHGAYERSMNAVVFEIAHDRTKAVLDMGGIAIIDATHLNRFRKQAIEQYRSLGAVTVGALVLDIPIEVAHARNEVRLAAGEGYVQPSDIDKMDTYRHAHPLSPAAPGAFDVVFELTPSGI